MYGVIELWMKGPYYIITDTQEMTLAFVLNLNFDTSSRQKKVYGKSIIQFLKSVWNLN